MLGAMAGSIAACIYPIPENIAEECEKRLPPDLLKIRNLWTCYSMNQPLTGCDTSAHNALITQLSSSFWKPLVNPIRLYTL